jgi:hypothetical protein
MIYKNITVLELTNPTYVPVLRDSTAFYGGSQMWFSDDIKRSKDYILQNYGCGTIATADLFLYLALRSNSYRSGVTESVLQGADSVIYKDYMSYVRKINTYYTKTKRYVGVLGPKIAHAFNSYARTYQFNLRAKWKLKLSYYDMLERIEEMLSRDIPIIFSIGPNTPLLWGRKGITFYQKETIDGDLYSYRPVKLDLNSHYVTVTGLFKVEGSDDSGQMPPLYTNKKIMLRISSWGKQYYISYDEYRDYISKSGGTFTSSMIYIK